MEDGGYCEDVGGEVSGAGWGGESFLFFSCLQYVSPLIISLLIVLRFGLREGDFFLGGWWGGRDNGRRLAMGACTDYEVEHPA